MTSDNIISCLARSRSRRNLCCPRYTPDRWFECDLAEITPAGYLREYEVKLSRKDFEIDRQKARRDGRLKHQMLKERSTDGPRQFWFVVPLGLVAEHEVPYWAGLIGIRMSNSGRLSEQQMVAAPILHRQPVRPEIEPHMRSVFYYRYWQLLERLHRRAAK